MATTTGRVALVTGGSRGIGAATCRLLAQRGWDVALSFRERADEAEEVADACQRAGRRAMTVRADVSEEAVVCALFDAVDDGLGAPRLLVNNAGVVPEPGRVEAYSADRVSRLLEANVLGPFLACREAVRRMSTVDGGDGGVIVNVSSRAAVLGSAGEYVDYAASKAALDALTVGLAHEVAGDGIRVVGVRPGLIDTDIHAPGRLARLGSTPPLGRPGQPDEVAAAIVWLASDEASYVTGATLDVGGGR